MPRPHNQTKSKPAIEAREVVESPASLMKRPKPVTSCTICGAPGYDIKLADGFCGRMVRGKRCRGTNQSAISDDDWRECSTCAASGYERVGQCSVCDGFGWVFQR